MDQTRPQPGRSVEQGSPCSVGRWCQPFGLMRGGGESPSGLGLRDGWLKGTEHGPVAWRELLLPRGGQVGRRVSVGPGNPPVHTLGRGRSDRYPAGPGSEAVRSKRGKVSACPGLEAGRRPRPDPRAAWRRCEEWRIHSPGAGVLPNLEMESRPAEERRMAGRRWRRRGSSPGGGSVRRHLVFSDRRHVGRLKIVPKGRGGAWRGLGGSSG